MCIVVDAGSYPLVEVIILHRIRCLGYVLLIPAHPVPFRASARSGQGWRKRHVNKAMVNGSLRLASVSSPVHPNAS